MRAEEAVRLPDAVIDAAVGWAVRINHSQPSDAQREAFQRWLQAAPLHCLAWERVNGLKGFPSELQALPPRLALDTLQGAQALRQQRQAMGRRHATKLLAMAGVAVGAGWLARDQAPWQRLLADASTGVGEQDTLRLADGSVVVLNTDSAVSVDLSGDRRLIALRRGEILITTGSGIREGDARPFWVHTPFGRLQALGTRFTVRLHEGHASVSVQDGAVQLYPAGGAAPVTVHAARRGHAAGKRTGLHPENAGCHAEGAAEVAGAGGPLTGPGLRVATDRGVPGAHQRGVPRYINPVYVPPSTCTFWPEMKPARSLQR